MARISRPSLPDATLAAVLLLAAEAQVGFDRGLREPRALLAVLALPILALAWARRAPLSALAAQAVGALAGLAVHAGARDEVLAGQLVALLAGLYCAGAYEPRLEHSALGLLIMLAAFWLNDARLANPPSEFLASATLTVGPWTAGRLVGRARGKAAELRAANAALTEERARARLAAAAAERARIARELHDIVAHSLSVIAVQADAAGALVHVRPHDAERSVDAVRTTARGALQEMRRLLGRLREDGGEIESQATLSQLERLIETAREAGADVALEVRGAPSSLPSALDVSAYRIVQEGLTNARRHAAGAACAVRIDYAEDAVGIEVRNAAGTAPAASSSPGYGLVGVHERVRALNGRLAVGPAPDGGWELRAHLPLERA